MKLSRLKHAVLDEWFEAISNYKKTKKGLDVFELATIKHSLNNQQISYSQIKNICDKRKRFLEKSCTSILFSLEYKDPTLQHLENHIRKYITRNQSVSLQLELPFYDIEQDNESH